VHSRSYYHTHTHTHTPRDTRHSQTWNSVSCHHPSGILTHTHTHAHTPVTFADWECVRNGGMISSPNEELAVFLWVESKGRSQRRWEHFLVEQSNENMTSYMTISRINWLGGEVIWSQTISTMAYCKNRDVQYQYWNSGQNNKPIINFFLILKIL